jgi:hypothetical protein
VSAQGRKTSAAAETVPKQQKQHMKNGTTRKRMCSKLSAVVALAYFQQKMIICRSQSEI